MPTWTTLATVAQALAAAGGLAGIMWLVTWLRADRERRRMRAADEHTTTAMADRATRLRAAVYEQARQD